MTAALTEASRGPVTPGAAVIVVSCPVGAGTEPAAFVRAARTLTLNRLSPEVLGQTLHCSLLPKRLRPREVKRVVQGSSARRQLGPAQLGTQLRGSLILYIFLTLWCSLASLFVEIYLSVLPRLSPPGLSFWGEGIMKSEGP